MVKNENNKERKKLFSRVNVKCFCCGKMVPDEGYRGAIEGQKHLFCTKECYDFYLEYRKMKRGTQK